MPRAPRAWDPLPRRLYLRALALILGSDSDPLGAGAGADTAVTPAYDPDSSASASTVFPWCYASSRSRASAIGRLPLRIYRYDGSSNGRSSREYLDDHWLVGLSERPNSSTPGVILAHEVQYDLDNDGNAYLFIVGISATDTTAQVMRAIQAGRVSLHRIPVKRCKQIPGQWGVKGYEITDDYGGIKVYDPKLVIHIRRGSFRDALNERLLGTGAVRPLTDLLNTEQSLTKRDNASAAKGRPMVQISPKDPNVRWTPQQVKDVEAAFSKVTKNDGGALILPGHADVQQMSWSPRDLASETVRETNRTAVLAAYDVPPIEVGLETANYATSKEQKAVFWESIQGDAVLHAWAWTEILRRAGERDTYAELDVSGVHELTGWKTEAVNRTNVEWLMGMDLIDAYRVNGLHEEADILQAKRDEKKAVKVPAEGSNSLRVVQWWGDDRAETVPADDEEARAERWRAIDKQLLAVGERNLGLVTRRFLTDQAERIADKLEQEGRAYVGPDHQRDDIDSLISRIFDEAAERRALDDATREEIKRILMRAFEQGQLDIDEDGVAYSADRIDQLVDEVLGELVVDVTDTTKRAVNSIVRQGLAEGQTIADMQFSLMQDQSFSAARALRIARTETTRSTAAGTVQAYEQAAGQLTDSGIKIRKQWLSSRDSAVRDSHMLLDGQTVDTDQPFTVPIGAEPSSLVGAQAMAPGGFSQAAAVVNCRCTVIPVIERTG